MTSSSNDEHEVLARIIDPNAWREPILPETFREVGRNASLETADRILTEFLPGYAERVRAACPPNGWEQFGTHADDEVPVIFSDELGEEDGLPKWERIDVDRVRAEQAEADAQIAASIASAAPAWDSERARTAERVARAIREANRHA